MDGTNVQRLLTVGARGPHPVAIIGAGFSGTISALHLLRTLPPDQQLLLFERAPHFGCGTAYGTAHPDHLLNVRAANMSAFPDQPDHFERWLAATPRETRRHLHSTAAGLFAARSLYGAYLQSLLNEAARDPASRGRLTLVRDSVIDAVPGGGHWILSGAGGATYQASRLVLAMGNLVSPQSDSAMFRANPWDPGALADLCPDAPVLVLGTGLTAMDVVMSLRAQDFKGRVIALSRRGLLPQAHAPHAPWPRPDFSPAERASTALMMRRLRAEIDAAAAQGVDWRGVIDALRPDSVGLWRGLPPAEKTRFLRHVRPHWDVRRHRLAPPVAEEVARLRASGFLRIVRGRLLRYEPGAALIRRYRAQSLERLAVQRIINATGVENAARCRDPLLCTLLARDLIRLDRLGLGLDVTDRLEPVSRNGAVTPGLWALGPLVRGVFWECTAVPDIRLQAAQLAASLVT